ncbi:hypothetical protein XM57_25580 [Burkholderia cepacia]|nr:hypothetical protein XM57_25580 [Burkholderia cepacia]ETP63730.1 hypothetical protein BDSB_19645 [Burkholderia dolosa PC543]
MNEVVEKIEEGFGFTACTGDQRDIFIGACQRRLAQSQGLAIQFPGLSFSSRSVDCETARRDETEFFILSLNKIAVACLCKHLLRFWKTRAGRFVISQLRKVATCEIERIKVI